MFKLPLSLTFIALGALDIQRSIYSEGDFSHEMLSILMNLLYVQNVGSFFFPLTCRICLRAVYWEWKIMAFSINI